MEILNTMGVNLKPIIIQGVGFLILLFILKKFLFGKISALIKSRSEEIKNIYDKTEKDRADAEKLKIEYQGKLSEAEIEAANRIQEAINEGTRIGEGIIKRANEEAEAMRIKARESIENERKTALADVRNQIVTLSILASSKIIKKSISRQAAERLVDDFVNEIEGLRVK